MVVARVAEEPQGELPLDSGQGFELDFHAMDHRRALAVDLAQRCQEGLRASMDHCHAEARAEAAEAPGCYAADPPDSPDTPDSGAAPRGTTCTRALCPCSGSPGWFG